MDKNEKIIVFEFGIDWNDAGYEVLFAPRSMDIKKEVKKLKESGEEIDLYDWLQEKCREPNKEEMVVLDEENPWDIIEDE